MEFECPGNYHPESSKRLHRRDCFKKLRDWNCEKFKRSALIGLRHSLCEPGFFYFEYSVASNDYTKSLPGISTINCWSFFQNRIRVTKSVSVVI